MRCEILIGDRESTKSFRVLKALEESAPLPVKVTTSYSGDCDLLLLWGVGREGHHQARDHQVKMGRFAALWDMGYLQTGDDHYYRVSLNHQHPQGWLDRTPNDPERFNQLGLALENIGDPKGHILVVGMGHKSHAFLKTHGWEQRQMAALRIQYPGKSINLRPKPHKKMRAQPIKTDMQRASLVVCRHSNAGVQAALWGVPVRSEDGAVVWLKDKEYTPENRLDFLRRLAHWQYKTSEFQQAWDFLLNITARTE